MFHRMVKRFCFEIIKVNIYNLDTDNYNLLLIKILRCVEIFFQNLISGSWLFNRKNNESLDELLQNEPDCIVLQEIEKQGESISFSHDNHGFFTTSEGQNPPLHYYEFR